MIDIEEEKRKDADLRQQIGRVNTLLILVLAALIIGPISVTWWLGRQIPVVSSLRITDAQIVGERVLCPGDDLTIAYTLNAEGAGVLIKDFTTWRTTPPETVIYSPWHRFILNGPTEQTHVDVWRVPATLANFRIGEVITYADIEQFGETMFASGAAGEELPLPPGEYERRISISSPTNSRAIAIIAMDFEVKSNCPSPVKETSE